MISSEVSLDQLTGAGHPYCEGAGYVKSVQTPIGEILIEAQKLAKAMDGKDAMLRVHPDVAKVLKASSNHFLEEMEETLGRPVLVTGNPTLHTERFDFWCRNTGLDARLREFDRSAHPGNPGLAFKLDQCRNHTPPSGLGSTLGKRV